MLDPYRTPAPPTVPPATPGLQRAWRRARPWLLYVGAWTLIAIVIVLTIPIRVAQGRDPFDC